MSDSNSANDPTGLNPSGKTEESSGFGAEDRAKTRRGTMLTVIGGLVMAGVRALGFFLRSIFGGEMWGLYAIAWALIELLAFVLIGGFGEAVVIFGARVKHGEGEEAGDLHYRALATLLRTPILASIVMAVCVHFGAEFLYEHIWSNHDPMLVQLVQTLGWGLPLLVLVQVPVEATRASLKFGYAVGIVQIALPILSLLSTLALYYTVQPTVLAVAQGLLIALVLCVPAAIFAYSRSYDLGRTVRACFTASWDRDALGFSLPQSLHMMLMQGFVRVDGLMLSFFGVSANSIGIYSLLGDLTQLLRLAKMAFSGVYSALIAKYRSQENKAGVAEALEVFARKTSSLSLVLLMAAMTLWPLAILHAGETWDGPELLPWLLCSGPLMSCFFGLANNSLLVFGHTRLLLVNAVVIGLTNIGLNAIFIPLWGVIGAAWATTISNVLIATAQVNELRYLEGLALRWVYYRRTLLAALLPVGSLFYLTVFAWPEGVFSWSDVVLRVTLAALAVGVYVALQLALPGKRPFGAPRT